MKKIVFIFFVYFCFTAKTFSQQSNDAGMWATFNLEKKINKRVFFFLTEEFRLRENFLRLNLFYTDIGLGVKPFDFLKVSVAYRPIQKFQDNNTFSYRHRLMLDITFKKKFSRFGFSCRERFQAENRNIYSSEKGHLLEWYARTKVKLDCDINKPITPYIAVETRYQINNPRAKEADGLFTRNRYFVGLDYKRSDKHSFGLYYMYQQEWDVSAPQDLFIIGIEYSISV